MRLFDLVGDAELEIREFAFDGTEAFGIHGDAVMLKVGVRLAVSAPPEGLFDVQFRNHLAAEPDGGINILFAIGEDPLLVFFHRDAFRRRRAVLNDVVAFFVLAALPEVHRVAAEVGHGKSGVAHPSLGKPFW